MAGILKFFQSIPKFFEEVFVELKKVSWTTREELLRSAWIVVVSSFFLGVFIAGTDLILSYFIGAMIR